MYYLVDGCLIWMQHFFYKKSYCPYFVQLLVTSITHIIRRCLCCCKRDPRQHCHCMATPSCGQPVCCKVHLYRSDKVLQLFICPPGCLYYAFSIIVTVRWAWLDWELSGWLTTLLQCFDTVGLVIRPVKHRPWNDLNCVEWAVKPYSTVHLSVPCLYDLPEIGKP